MRKGFPKFGRFHFVRARRCTVKKFFQKNRKTEKRFHFPAFCFLLCRLSVGHRPSSDDRRVLLNFNFSMCLWIEWNPNIQLPITQQPSNLELPHNSHALLSIVTLLHICTTSHHRNGCLVRKRFQSSPSWRDWTKWSHQSLHRWRRRIHRLSHCEEAHGRGMDCDQLSCHSAVLLPSFASYVISIDFLCRAAT